MKGKEIIAWIQGNKAEEDDVVVDVIPMRGRPSGMYECFHCGARSVIWQSDFMFEDYGYDGNGIVQNCMCGNCGAEIEYRIPLDDEEEEDANGAGEDTTVH